MVEHLTKRRLDGGKRSPAELVDYQLAEVRLLAEIARRDRLTQPRPVAIGAGEPGRRARSGGHRSRGSVVPAATADTPAETWPLRNYSALLYTGSQ